MAPDTGAAYHEAMNSRPTTLERAFALAKSGEYQGMADIRLQLKAEGYTLSQLEGRTLTRQLQALCVAARGAAEA